MLSIRPVVDVNEILQSNSSIALVGFSPKVDRPSHRVGKYLMDVGFTVFPVNPGVSEVCGRKSYPDLASIPEPIDIVDIFRRSEEVLPIVQAAIAIHAKVIWMQQGIINEEAARLAEKAGLKVIMDRCIMVDHKNMGKIQVN